MDGEAWWAAVHGVAQSRTRLKRLSSSRRFPEVRNHTQFEEEVLKGHFKRMVGFWQMGSWKESVLMRWMKLEPIIQSEVSQKEKHQYSILTHIYGI